MTRPRLTIDGHTALRASALLVGLASLKIR